MAVATRTTSEKWRKLGDTGDVEDHFPTVGQFGGTGEAAWEPAPVVYGTDQSIFLNLGSMRVGRFYPVVLGGEEMVAVKEVDDSVSFYTAPPKS